MELVCPATTRKEIRHFPLFTLRLFFIASPFWENRVGAALLTEKEREKERADSSLLFSHILMPDASCFSDTREHVFCIKNEKKLYFLLSYRRI